MVHHQSASTHQSTIPVAQRIMVALDVDELPQAQKLAEDLQGLGVALKIGNQLGTYEGWQAAIAFAHGYGARIFCDTKFKDIPHTVEKSAWSITRHQPEFFTVMADTTLETLRAAVKGRDEAAAAYGLARRPAILGVTVLTSISNQASTEIYGAGSSEKVLQFAANAARAGLDGVICSAQEAALLRKHPATKKLLLVTPGIRPQWAAANDQARPVTPARAIQDGADYLVIGRPITQPPMGTPREAVLRIIKELEQEK